METPICGIPQFVIVKKCGLVFKAKETMGEIRSAHGKDEKCT